MSVLTTSRGRTARVACRHGPGLVGVTCGHSPPAFDLDGLAVLGFPSLAVLSAKERSHDRPLG